MYQYSDMWNFRLLHQFNSRYIHCTAIQGCVTSIQYQVYTLYSHIVLCYISSISGIYNIQPKSVVLHQFNIRHIHYKATQCCVKSVQYQVYTLYIHIVLCYTSSISDIYIIKPHSVVLHQFNIRYIHFTSTKCCVTSVQYQINTLCSHIVLCYISSISVIYNIEPQNVVLHQFNIRYILYTAT